ncbi:MAG: signal peptidase I [Firmicutes bacterium]|nr:signal peptidase I [Bacillota bacterium]
MEGTVQVDTTEVKKQQGFWVKLWQITGNIAFAILLLVMIFIMFSLVQSRLLKRPPSIAGYQMYIVLGGSMSPTFEAGSLAFLKPVSPAEIKEGDIITYRSPFDPDNITTHRVMEVHYEDNQYSFTTRGDANDVDDANPVLAGDVIGKVHFTIPYAGYLMNFGRSKSGLLALVIIPGLLIIIFEVRNIFHYAVLLQEEKKKKSTPHPVETEQQS